MEMLTDTKTICYIFNLRKQEASPSLRKISVWQSRAMGKMFYDKYQEVGVEGECVSFPFPIFIVESQTTAGLLEKVYFNRESTLIEPKRAKIFPNYNKEIQIKNPKKCFLYISVFFWVALNAHFYMQGVRPAMGSSQQGCCVCRWWERLAFLRPAFLLMTGLQTVHGKFIIF